MAAASALSALDSDADAESRTSCDFFVWGRVG